MEEMLGVVVFGVVLLVTLWVSSRSIRSSGESARESFAILDQVLEDTKNNMSKHEEYLSQQKRLIEQGDETIALLNAINENIEHRSIKN